MPKLANGFLCFGPSFFVSAAFILSMYAQWRCNYVNTGSDAEVNSENGLRFVEKIGPTCYTAIGGVAYKYPEGTISDTVQGLSLATVVMGAISWCIYLFAACCRFPPPLWLLTSLLCLATAVTEGLVFHYMFNSDVCVDSTCSWGTGAKCAISAMTFWSLSCVMTCGVFQQAQAEKNSDE